VPGGGLGFHWQVQLRDLEIEFTPNGSVAYLMTSNDPANPVSAEGVLASFEDDPRIWKWLIGA
jgi:hypothetical protein